MLEQPAGVDAIGLGETGLLCIHTRTHNRQAQLRAGQRRVSTSARTGLDPDSTKLAVEVDSVGAIQCRRTLTTFQCILCSSYEHARYYYLG